MKHTINFYSASIKPVCFGKAVLYQVSGDAFRRPFETKATHGDHNYKTCENCKRDWLKVFESAKIMFDRFPNCCSYHANLAKRDWFDKNTLGNIPVQAADKYIYTKQHITNRFNTEDWYNDITEYIDYTVDSFGQFPPGCGEPFFLGNYIKSLIRLYEQSRELPAEKRDKILEYLQAYLKPEKDRATDLDALAKIYNKWLNTFPFNFDLFTNLKQYFESQLPVFTGTEEYNRYSGQIRIRMQTRTGLIAELYNTTRKLLDEIDSAQLLANGSIEDIDKYEFGLLQSNHRVQQATLVRKFSKGELRYVEVLSKWLAREEEYFNKIARFLKIKKSKQGIQGEGMDKIFQNSKPPVFEHFDEIFRNPAEASDLIEVLRIIEPPLIDDENRWIQRRGNKSAFVAWIQVLEQRGKIYKVDERMLTKLANAKFINLELGTDGSLFRKVTGPQNEFHTKFLALIPQHQRALNKKQSQF